MARYVTWDDNPSSSSDSTRTYHYFLHDTTALQAFHADDLSMNDDIFYWTPWATNVDTWIRLHPADSTQRKIYL